MYFVTICIDDHKHLLGEIENKRMIPNEIGKIVEKEWRRTIEIRPDMNLTLDVFVVTPNHFHAIIIIGKNQYNTNNGNFVDGRDAMHCVSTPGVTPPDKPNPYQNLI